MPLVIGKMLKDDGGKVIDADQIDFFKQKLIYKSAFPVNGTIYLERNVDFLYSVDSMLIITGAGTIEVTARINTTNITGLVGTGGLQASTTEQTLTASGLNLTAIGDQFNIVLANASGASDLHVEFLLTYYGSLAVGGK